MSAIGGFCSRWSRFEHMDRFLWSGMFEGVLFRAPSGNGMVGSCQFLDPRGVSIPPPTFWLWTLTYRDVSARRAQVSPRVLRIPVAEKLYRFHSAVQKT